LREARKWPRYFHVRDFPCFWNLELEKSGHNQHRFTACFRSGASEDRRLNHFTIGKK